MRNSVQRPCGGKHRKVNPASTTKGRVALVAMTAGAASTAGLGGATAANLTNSGNENLQTMAASTHAAELSDQVTLTFAQPAVPETAASPTTSPQILPVAEYRPVNQLSEQLSKAIEAFDARIAAENDERILASNPFLSQSSQHSPDGSVVKPTEGTFTSGYGMRWGSLHAGIDIAGPIGTPILAAKAGEVISSGPASGYGNWIRILHDDGSVTLYGHMVSLDVSVGDRVLAGQKIASMGSEGFSTGSHLHFEIHPDGSTPVDPIPWFAEHGIIIE